MQNCLKINATKTISFVNSRRLKNLLSEEHDESVNKICFHGSILCQDERPDEYVNSRIKEVQQAFSQL